MGLEKLGMSLAQKTSTWIKTCGKTNILQTKPAKKIELKGLKFTDKPNLDTVELSLKKFILPEKTEIQEILTKHSITGKSVLFSGKEIILDTPFINSNNGIFLKRLDEIFPAVKGKRTKDLEELMICLENINHGKFKNKESFLQNFIKDFNDLKMLTDITGKKLFGQGTTSLYTIKAILQAKYNNPERYQEIMDLYKLHKEGKAPRYLLEVLFPESSFHYLPKSDIQKLLKGESYYPKLKALNEAEIMKLPQGEAFSVGEEMFVRTLDGYEKLKINPNIYEQLFPPIERYAIAQGKLENCHLIATLDGMTKHPEGRIKLYKMFEQTPTGVKCKLPNCNDYFEEFQLQDLSKLNSEFSLQGSLGHKMLEKTYASYRYKASKGSLVGATSEDILKVFNRGGDETYIKQYYKDILGFESSIVNSKDLRDYGQDYRELIRNSANGKIVAVDCHLYDFNKGLSSSHYYNAVDVPNSKIINPWNTLEVISKDPLTGQMGHPCIGRP